MRVRLISPFDDAEQIWIGLDEPGYRRKVFRFLSPEMGSEEFMAGITVFEPGEASSYHVHESSEEMNLVLSGSGVLVSEGEVLAAPAAIGAFRADTRAAEGLWSGRVVPLTGVTP